MEDELVQLEKDFAHTPAPYTNREIYAIQALMRGEATADQQEHALRWIIECAARAYDLSYQENDGLGTAFAEGRRFTGLQIVKLTKLKPIKDEE